MKDYNEEQKKEIVELIAEFAGFPVTHKHIQSFVKEKGLIPALELGHVYKDYTLPKYLFMYDNNGDRYGFDLNGIWLYEKSNPTKSLSILNNGTANELESDGEWFEALSKEWESKGGFKYDSYSFSNNVLSGHTHSGKVGIENCGCIEEIFINGVFATIVPTPTEMTVAQLEQKHGYTNLKIVK